MNNKCKNCGGAIIFDIASQNFKCNSCDVTTDFLEDIDIEEISENLKETGYKCTTCGAEILADENTVSTFCLFCKNPTIIPNKFEIKNKPTQIIPFKISFDEAKNIYYSYIKKKKLAPQIFKEKTEIETITPLYVPFFLYNTDVSGDFKINAQKIERRSTSTHNITTTHYYDVFLKTNSKYEKIPIDASIKIKNNLCRLIEPFNFNDMVNFNELYLSGYFSEKNDISSEEIINSDLKPIVERFLKERVLEEIKYDSKSIMQNELEYAEIEKNLILLPMYILSVRYNDNLKQFLINGQTGKISGESPIGFKSTLKQFSKVFFPSALLIWTILSIFEYGMA